MSDLFWWEKKTATNQKSIKMNISHESPHLKSEWYRVRLLQAIKQMNWQMHLKHFANKFFDAN